MKLRPPNHAALLAWGLLLALLAGAAATEPPTPDAATTPPPEADVPAAAAGEVEREAEGEDEEKMAPRFERWLEEVDPLITAPERALFLSLAKNYQRDAFIQQFWKVRDPHPKTPRNELKER